MKEIYVCAKEIIATPSGSLVGKFLALSLVLLLQQCFYVAFLVPVLSGLFLNEGIPRALKGKKLSLKNIMLPLIFEDSNSFQSFKYDGKM